MKVLQLLRSNDQQAALSAIFYDDINLASNFAETTTWRSITR